ncbi:MAG: GNAT family N-acetyltransferase [Oscillospiraceae bacterium]
MEINLNEFLISDDKTKIQIDRVCQLLNTSYWAKDRPRETIEKALINSICFGIYKDEQQIGFARCVTDFSTVYWLADVIIDNNYRGLGLGKALVNAIVNHEKLKGCFGILATSDAHGLYEKYGFNLVNDRYMRKNAD